MADIIKYGVPTDSGVLNYWNNFLTTVIADPLYSNVFKISPNGFMTQFTYIAGTVSSIKVMIPYKNSSQTTIKGQCVLYTQSDENVNIALLFEPTDTDFATLAFDLTINAEQVTKAAFEVNNNSIEALLIAGISIDCTIASNASSSIDTADYIQSAIIFGTDASKPALR